MSMGLSHQFLDGGDDALRAGNIELFQWRAEWHRGMWSRNELDRRVQFGEGFIGNEGCNVCGGAAARVVLVNHNQPVRLCYGIEYGLFIQGRKCARVDDLR